MQKNKAFQGLRFFAFLNVFLLHVGSYRVDSFKNDAAWAVSFFIMISGFIYGYSLSNKKIIIKDTFNFTVKKIMKFYPLYIITTLAFVPFSSLVMSKPFNVDFKIAFMNLIKNFLLIQSWSFDRGVNYSFNGVGWFLSTFVFLIFITIPLMCLFNKLIFKKDNINYNFRIIVIETIVTIIYFVYILIVCHFKLDVIQFLYIFPPGRIFEYIIAILLGIYCKLNFIKKEEKKLFYTILEIITIILMMILLSKMYLHNTLDRSPGWILPNILLLIVFYQEKGIVSKILGNKVFVHLGDISFNMYLLHQVINMYVYIVPMINSDLIFSKKLRIFSVILFLTIVISDYLYEDSYIKRKIKIFIQKIDYGGK